jgi:hypothetical protein
MIGWRWPAAPRHDLNGVGACPERFSISQSLENLRALGEIPFFRSSLRRPSLSAAIPDGGEIATVTNLPALEGNLQPVQPAVFAVSVTKRGAWG